LKFQIINPKKQTNNNDRNSKSQTKKTIALKRFEIWNLRPARSCLAMAGGFICNLVLEICDLRHQTAKAEPGNSDSRHAGKDQAF